MNKVHAAGFTLIELMMTLVVLAILLTVGVPSFNQILLNSRTAALANDLTSAVNLARAEAITRAELVSVCPSDDASTCSGAWTDGWIVVVDRSGPPRFYESLTAPADGSLIEQEPTAAANSAIDFGPLGRQRTTTDSLLAQVDGCRGERARRLRIAPSGRVSVTREACA